MKKGIWQARYSFSEGGLPAPAHSVEASRLNSKASRNAVTAITIRQAGSLRRLREDKPATEIRRETLRE